MSIFHLTNPDEQVKRDLYCNDISINGQASMDNNLVVNNLIQADELDISGDASVGGKLTVNSLYESYAGLFEDAVDLAVTENPATVTSVSAKFLYKKSTLIFKDGVEKEHLQIKGSYRFVVGTTPLAVFSSPFVISNIPALFQNAKVFCSQSGATVNLATNNFLKLGLVDTTVSGQISSYLGTLTGGFNPGESVFCNFTIDLIEP
jgi:hypothetical protein